MKKVIWCHLLGFGLLVGLNSCIGDIIEPNNSYDIYTAPNSESVFVCSASTQNCIGTAKMYIYPQLESGEGNLLYFRGYSRESAPFDNDEGFVVSNTENSNFIMSSPIRPALISATSVCNIGQRSLTEWSSASYFIYFKTDVQSEFNPNVVKYTCIVAP